MTQVLVTESHLEDIAEAIRGRNGSNSTYTPAAMADAIDAIRTADEVTLVQKSVTANGTYSASSDEADGFSQVSVNVPNSYAEGDEGKVVSNGALVAQTSFNVTENDTYDTTLYDEVTVNVAGGGGGGSQTGAIITPIDLGSGSFIGERTGSLAVGNGSYSSYKAIALELDSLPEGVLVTIENSGDRNYWGLYDSITSDSAIKGFSSRQQASGGVLRFYPGDFKLLAEYLVYDYTSSSDGLPTVKTVPGSSGGSVTFTPPFKLLEPYAFDAQKGYMMTGYWQYDGTTSGTGGFSDVYELEVGHNYVVFLGYEVGNRFRVMVANDDITQVTSGTVSGRSVTNTDNPSQGQSAYFKVSSSDTYKNYLVIGKTNIGQSGIPTFVVDASSEAEPITIEGEAGGSGFTHGYATATFENSTFSASASGELVE